MSKANDLLPQLNEEDNIMPTVRVLVLVGGDVRVNKPVSKKAKIKDILIANNLDPDKPYLMDQHPVDVEKTIVEIIPKSKADLLEAELIIETTPLDLELTHEIRYEPILKPAEKPFRIYSFNPKQFDITMKYYSDKSIKKLKLDNFSEEYSAYCNTPKDLFISGGQNGGKGNHYFWKVNKQNFGIERLRNLKSDKEHHTMFFVPKKYIYFIGGNTQETYFYNLLKNDFEEWGPLNKERIKPCVALANRSQMYVFDSQPDSPNSEFIEKSDLFKGQSWELLKINLSTQFPLTNYSSAVDFDNKIYLFGGKTNGNDYSFVFDTKANSLVPYEQENYPMITTDKTFYPINDFNSALVPNFDGDKLNVHVFNRRKKKFRILNFNPEVEKLVEVKELKSPMDKKENEKMSLLYKKAEKQENETMPDISEGLIRFPTLEELKAPRKAKPELNVDIKGPSLNIEQPKVEGEIGLPGLDINGPKIDAGIDIQGPKIGEPGISVDINGPNIDADVDINAPSARLRGPKPKKGEVQASVPEVNVQGNLPSLSAMLDPNAGVNVNAPKFDAPGFDIQGPKIGGPG
jgi:hypothetical protein